MTAPTQTQSAGRTRTPRPRKAAELRVVDEQTTKPLPVPGSPGIFYLDGDCLIRTRGDHTETFLDWAPRLIAWWTDADGVPIYRVQVKDQTEDVLPETLRDGSAWDLFDHAAGHDVRNVREALASVVKMQRRSLPKAPGLSALGWHEVNGETVYVTSGTCFGPVGEVVVNVHAYDADEAILPPAPTGDRLRDVVGLSLSILDAAVLRVSAPAMCSVWLAPVISLFGNDLPRFVPWMWSDGRAGVFGVLKSSFAAILQAHSGSGYRGESDLLPAADTTFPALSGILGVRRDGLAILDDYKPGETYSVESGTQTTMERGIRMATNRQKRALRRYKGPGRATVQACMALLMVTGECLPLFNSGSTHDRTFPFQVHKGDIRPDRLTVLQDRVDDFPEAASGYVSWIAGRHEKVTALLGARFRELRAELRQGEQVTGRACSHIAHMMCAAELFTEFAVEVGALNAGRREQLLREIREALTLAASDAVTERTEDQPHEVWLSHLRAQFECGRLYAETTNGTRPTQYADALGWGDGDFPRGRARAGYATEDGLALVEDASNAAVMELVKQTGKPLSIGGVQLRRLLAGKGVIRWHEHKDGLHEHQTQFRVGSARPWCPVIPWNIFLGTSETPGTGSQDGPGGGGPETPTTPAGTPEQPQTQEFDPALTTARGPDGLAVHGPEGPCVACGQPAKTRSVAGEPLHIDAMCTPVTPVVPRQADIPTIPAPLADVTDRMAGRTFGRDDQEQAYRARVAVLDGMDPDDDSDEAIVKAATGLRIAEAMTDDPGEDRKKDGPFAPVKYGTSAPYWIAPLPDIAPPLVAHSGWGTFTADSDYRGLAAVLDRNAGHPSALSSLRVAHGALEQTGALPDAKRPGYYKTLVHPWNRADLPNPMGNREVGSEVWITHERMRLLEELTSYGPEWWPGAEIIDSYTAERETSLRDLSQLIKHLRSHVIDTHGKDSVQWEAVKEATNTKLIQILMGSPKDRGTLERWTDREWYTKCRRTDWAHALHDKAAANLYRVAIKLSRAGVPVLAVRHMDEIVIPTGQLESVISRGLIKADETGKTFGTFKTKGTEEWGV